jgi:GT2 family glycosyltransferase
LVLHLLLSFPRSIINEVGLFQENYRGIGSDSDFYLRCLVAGYSLIYNHQTTAIQRQHHSGQITSNPRNISLRQTARLERIQNFYPIVKRKDNSLDEKKLYAELYFYFANQYLKRGLISKWWQTSIQSMQYTSPTTVMINIIRDLKIIFLA